MQFLLPRAQREVGRAAPASDTMPVLKIFCRIRCVAISEVLPAVADRLNDLLMSGKSGTMLPRHADFQQRPVLPGRVVRMDPVELAVGADAHRHHRLRRASLPPSRGLRARPGTGSQRRRECRRPAGARGWSRIRRSDSIDLREAHFDARQHVAVALRGHAARRAGRRAPAGTGRGHPRPGRWRGRPARSDPACAARSGLTMPVLAKRSCRRGVFVVDGLELTHFRFDAVGHAASSVVAAVREVAPPRRRARCGRTGSGGRTACADSRSQSSFSRQNCMKPKDRATSLPR